MKKLETYFALAAIAVIVVAISGENRFLRSCGRYAPLPTFTLPTCTWPTFILTSVIYPTFIFPAIILLNKKTPTYCPKSINA
jgi:hypothetical protein